MICPFVGIYSVIYYRTVFGCSVLFYRMFHDETQTLFDFIKGIKLSSMVPPVYIKYNPFIPMSKKFESQNLRFYSSPFWLSRQLGGEGSFVIDY